MNPKILKLLSIKILRIQMYSEEIWSVRFPVTRTCPLTVTYNYVICTLIVIIMHYEMIVTYCKRDDFKYTMILAIITIKYWYFFYAANGPKPGLEPRLLQRGQTSVHGTPADPSSTDTWHLNHYGTFYNVLCLLLLSILNMYDCLSGQRHHNKLGYFLESIIKMNATCSWIL